MSKLVYLTLIFLLRVLCSNGQADTASKLVGQWGICYNLDTVDISCDKPFNSYVFNKDGSCQHGSVVIVNEKIPITGTWSYQNGNINIVYSKHPNYKVPLESFTKIVFVNDNLFYYKVLDKVENPDHCVFFSFKRIE